jgi:DNA-binding FadR family transcriptional regulator
VDELLEEIYNDEDKEDYNRILEGTENPFYKRILGGTKYLFYKRILEGTENPFCSSFAALASHKHHSRTILEISENSKHLSRCKIK